MITLINNIDKSKSKAKISFKHTDDGTKTIIKINTIHKDLHRKDFKLVINPLNYNNSKSILIATDYIENTSDEVREVTRVIEANTDNISGIDSIDLKEPIIDTAINIINKFISETGNKIQK